MTRNLVRVYRSYVEARETAIDLEHSGVPTSAINIIGNRHVCEETARLAQPTTAVPGASVGATLGSAAGLLAGLGLIAIPGLGPVVAAGPLAIATVGAIAGTTVGGLASALIDNGKSYRAADGYCEAVRRGGTMVGVRVGARHAERAEQIMNRRDPLPVPG